MKLISTYQRSIKPFINKDNEVLIKKLNQALNPRLETDLSDLPESFTNMPSLVNSLDEYLTQMSILLSKNPVRIGIWKY